MNMEELKEKLSELRDLMKSDRPDKEEVFHRKMDEINSKYAFPEAGNLIFEFIMDGFADIEKGLKEIEERIDKLTACKQV